jgi:hypothetical protein
MKMIKVLHALVGIVGILIFLFAGFFMQPQETFPTAAQELKEARDTHIFSNLRLGNNYDK